MTIQQITKRLRSFADPAKAKLLQGFFKTGPGEYGEGDRFLGVMVLSTRKVAREFRDAPLYRLAASKNLWKRRIAVVSTFHFIRNRDYADSLRIAELMLDDHEDLIHKATGWMLREVGKRDQAVLESFLWKHHQSMPRTMLRYAIERFPEAKRRRYLAVPPRS